MLISSVFWSVSFAVSVYAQSTVVLKATRDATIDFSKHSCNNGDSACTSVTYGLDANLVTVNNWQDYQRVLVGFDLPERTIPKSCLLQVPRPLHADPKGYGLKISSTDSNWNERTVSADSKTEGTETLVGLVQVEGNKDGGSVDVTSACKSAVENDRISFVIDTTSLMVTFNSIQSKSDDLFSLIYTH
ncbi:hypothetical protein COEREDRAFT_82614 [Coemansia reversa NRRL 1564]|uniref:Carbohydrate-binding module family 96 domain-containing protein n=1 Tax=Coemansia reversa (strain ATCC 12441 / NRRL 1564) TaxID=763665 RepID=A0A2G5B6E6_COERN|nr:hypothetical protein COEREDRAFT_82614 [Coemansia reversa NRRL 1564]|eukprot:PIA14578.1 hypothetical protein COEREDRAFT_82614 [Coemansia reversa NRRL 1564]